ncbi:uncharacterized protein LOC141630358 [Silene latifolia]|uniref:uncharacterized protein LOC141630358 n=1 Tax=Silene latifolia TaxID=37657 RepID=UPI003D7738AB
MTKQTNKSIHKSHTSARLNTTAAIPNEKAKLLGQPDVDEGQRFKHMHEVNDIPAIVFSDAIVEDCEEFSDPDEENNQDEAWFQVHGKNIIQIIDEEPEPLLQITEDDVQSEIDYWQQAVVGFIVGANPPWQVLEGFLQRIWSKYVIDKISFLPNGVSLARFQSEEMKQAVLGSGHFLFDNKPLILKAWQPDVELTKEVIKSVPALIRIHKLPLKFWGKSLPKIASLVGKYVKSDSPTDSKTRLGFARVMVELQLGQAFPNSIKFLDEKLNVMTVDIEYEWKPSVCTKCKQIGHEKEQCRKNTQQKVRRCGGLYKNLLQCLSHPSKHL